MSLPLSFSESSTILSFFLSRPLPILLCPESTHHFSALSTPCKHDDGGGDDDDDGGGDDDDDGCGDDDVGCGDDYDDLSS